jgi:DNA-binding NarL/FixJ family response regulator
VPPGVPIRLFVCDDSPGYAALIGSWAEVVGGVLMVGEATRASELLERLPDARPDVVLLDHHLPEGPTSAALVDQVRGLAPGVRVVVVSGHDQEELVRRAGDAGADACCSKMVGVEELLEAVTGGSAAG